MPFFRAFAYAIITIVAALLIYATTKPDSFSVERSIEIHAPAARIFPLIDELQKHQLWSPFEKMDPAMKRNYRNPASGAGASYEWDGSGQAGKGSMTILESRPDSLVRLRLDFVRPFVTSNIVEFTLVPDGDNTTVTWRMSGPMPYVSKLMTIFFDMNKMIGGQFDEGLNNLKNVVEKQNAQ